MRVDSCCWNAHTGTSHYRTHTHFKNTIIQARCAHAPWTGMAAADVRLLRWRLQLVPNSHHQSASCRSTFITISQQQAYGILKCGSLKLVNHFPTLPPIYQAHPAGGACHALRCKQAPANHRKIA